MTTTITADTGAVSGSAGLKQSADSSGVLALATGTGTTAITIDASQNVGIGTSSPSQKLDVIGVARVNEDGAGTKVIQLRSNYASLGPAIQVTTNDPLLFLTNNTERARIDSSGNLLVGLTSKIVSASTICEMSGSSGIGIRSTGGDTAPAGFFWNNATTGNNVFLQFATEAGGTVRGSITYNRGGGLTAYNVTSDYRSKTVNGPVENALAKVAALKPCTGRMNDAEYDIDFFVAHELQEVVPSAVTGEKDAVNEDGSAKYQMVDKSAIIPLLTAAIQEQQSIIEQLRADVEALKAA
jgi:hypothetical protein